MPPKKPAAGKKQNDSTIQDKKKVKEIAKVAEDKAFGMKNKNKSKVVQKMIKGMAATSIKGGMDNIIGAAFEERKKKEEQEKERQFLASIKLGDIRAVNEDTAPVAALQVCPYFKAGLCQKGKKCKFSHDKGNDGTTKANLYQDIRGEDNADSMNNWDQKKLEEAVNFNENKYVNPNATDLPCHNFLNAIAEKRYGWFWVCPNGVNCKYKHALPPGFVLKTKEKEEKVEFNVERDIDAARQMLEGGSGTPVTFERFLVWRDKRRLRKAKEADDRKAADVKKAGIKVAKGKKIMTGKSLFVFDPTMFKDDEDAVGKKDLVEEGEMVEGEDAATQAELNKGGKKWEAKKVEVVEEVIDEKDGEDGAEAEEEGEDGAMDIDEDAFADEEELPDDI